jgi:pyruvate-ferredoxin/flavodoxin oxidoreductase
VKSGIWPLYRFDPRRISQGLSPMQLDSGEPADSVENFMRNEVRFQIVQKNDPKRFKELVDAANRHVRARYMLYQQLSQTQFPQFVKSESSINEASGQI